MEKNVPNDRESSNIDQSPSTPHNRLALVPAQNPTAKEYQSTNLATRRLAALNISTPSPQQLLAAGIAPSVQFPTVRNQPSPASMEPRPSNLEIRPPPSNKSVSTGDKRKQDYLTDDEQKDLQFKYNLKRVKPEGFRQDKDEDTFNKLWREPKALPVSHGLPDLNDVGRKALCAHWFIEGTYHRDKERGGDKTGPQDSLDANQNGPTMSDENLMYQTTADIARIQNEIAVSQRRRAWLNEEAAELNKRVWQRKEGLGETEKRILLRSEEVVESRKREALLSEEAAEIRKQIALQSAEVIKYNVMTARAQYEREALLNTQLAETLKQNVSQRAEKPEYWSYEESERFFKEWLERDDERGEEEDNLGGEEAIGVVAEEESGDV